MIRVSVLGARTLKQVHLVLGLNDSVALDGEVLPEMKRAPDYAGGRTGDPPGYGRHTGQHCGDIVAGTLAVALATLKSGQP